MFYSAEILLPHSEYSFHNGEPINVIFMVETHRYAVIDPKQTSQFNIVWGLCSHALKLGALDLNTRWFDPW